MMKNLKRKALNATMECAYYDNMYDALLYMQLYIDRRCCGQRRIFGLTKFIKLFFG